MSNLVPHVIGLVTAVLVSLRLATAHGDCANTVCAAEENDEVEAMNVQLLQTRKTSSLQKELVQIVAQAADCKDATEEDHKECFTTVMWTKDVGYHTHPEWYTNMTEDSSFVQWQCAVYTSNPKDCPRPCDDECKQVAEPVSGQCTDATSVDAEDCYASVSWAKNVGIYGNPEWYDGLSSNSSFTDFQCDAFKKLKPMEKGCPRPCGGECCMDVTSLNHEECYASVSWSSGTGIFTNPEWYEGLTKDSSFADFQCLAYRSSKEPGHGTNCPRPCSVACEEVPEEEEEIVVPATCRDVTEESDKDCHTSVSWTKNVGIYGHPEWYTDVTSESSFEDFQCSAFKKGGCPRPCGSEACCIDVTSKNNKGCYETLMWHKNSGYWTHPEWYEGLTNSSSLAEFQCYAYQTGETGAKNACPMPCSASCEKRIAVVPEAAVAPECLNVTKKNDEDCFTSVSWSKNVGIWTHPEWYAGLTNSSSFMDFQCSAYQKTAAGAKGCPRPCSDACEAKAEVVDAKSPKEWRPITRSPKEWRPITRKETEEAELVDAKSPKEWRPITRSPKEWRPITGEAEVVDAKSPKEWRPITRSPKEWRPITR